MRDRRLLLLAIAVGVAAIVTIVAIVVGTRGSSSSSKTPTTAAPARTRALLAGIRQRGLELGAAGAPATLVEFADMQCPYCAHWAVDTFPSVVDRFVRTGRVRLEFRGLHFIGPDSEKALRAVVAASFQNKLWNMVEALYERQGTENTGWVTDALLREAGRSIPGLDVEAMMAERGSTQVTQVIRQDDRLANAARVRGTPTFVVEKPPALGQQLQLQSLEPGAFNAALAAAVG